MNSFVRLFSTAMILTGTSAVMADTPAGVVIHDFESAQAQAPKVWFGNMPHENASASISDDPKDVAAGKRALLVDYRFTGEKQHFGVPVEIDVKKPFRTLKFQMRGDGSNVTYGVYLIDASGETHKYQQPGTMRVDYKGWKEISVDLSQPHETWGGDKNAIINYPLTGLSFELSTPRGPGADAKAAGQLAFDNIIADPTGVVAQVSKQMIAVTSPGYRAEVQGVTPIAISAPELEEVTVKGWKAKGDKYGEQTTIAKVKLDASGNGSFDFPADEYPHGPITLTISGDRGDYKDNCYLQLYNTRGVKWQAGIPSTTPPAAKGLKLLFSDDFDVPLSIGAGPNFKYFDHKPPRGATDFSWPLRFTSHDQPNTPFKQVDSYLRIRASEKQKSAGIISSLQSDGTGFKVTAPAYFECRFIGPNAIGSWPAFWLMTDHMSDGQDKNTHNPCDELDIIEAYGGEGPKAPNAYDKYMVSMHTWNQGDAGQKIKEEYAKTLVRPTEMKKFGIPSTWFETPHVYGCLVTETETIYYCNDIEINRHKTLPLSKDLPLFFMINLAVGGGWPVDLSRYDGEIDMYVDYVRVYGKE